MFSVLVYTVSCSYIIKETDLINYLNLEMEVYYLSDVFCLFAIALEKLKPLHASENYMH